MEQQIRESLGKEVILSDPLRMILDRKKWVAKHLGKLFADAQRRNPRYSLRAFARKLKLPPSSVSELLAGRRAISKTRALQVLEAAGVSEKTLAQLANSEESKDVFRKLGESQTVKSETVLELHDSELILDWLYFAIVASVRTCDFNPDPRVLAARFGVTVARIRRCWSHLEELGVLKRDANGQVICNRMLYRGGDDLDDRSRQSAGLEKALEAIRSREPRQKGTYATIAVNRKRVGEVEKLVEAFLKQTAIYLSEGEPEEKDDVFELAIQFFPLTRAT